MMKRIAASVLCLMLCFSNVFMSYANAGEGENDPNQELLDQMDQNGSISSSSAESGLEQNSVSQAGQENLADGADKEEADSNLAEPASEPVQGEENEAGIDDNSRSIKEVLEFSYQAHCKNIGWQSSKKAGETAGTVGSALQMEALKINISDNLYQGGIEYRVHVKNIGWQGWKKQGEIAGTEGRSLQIEAVQLRLTGELANHYTVAYQTHIEDFGWLSEVNEGALSGSEGMGKRVEALKIRIMPKNEAVKPSGRGYIKGYASNALTYNGHVQNVGDTSWTTSEMVCGTTGRGLRMEGLTVKLDDAGADVLKGSLEYAVHGQDYGWQSWRQEGEYAGTRGQNRRIEAVKIRLKGEAAYHYDVYYRCHVQDIGWMGWASNGNPAGTTGISLRVEAVQIKLVSRGMAAPGQTSDCYREGKQGWFYENGYHFYYQNGQKLTDVRGVLGPKGSYEICINKQMSCVTVYAQDSGGTYNIPVVAFACSPGSETPTGVFYTENKYRWHQLYGAMGQWCTRITGHVLFHSPPYTRFDNHTLWPAEYNKLGSWASAGCVRLRSGDAKWIYDNCSLPTKVTIYNSDYPGPLGKPSYEHIPLWQTWDPTDPTV